MRRQASALAPRCDARDCLQQIGFCSTSAQAFQEADQGIHLMDPKSKVRNAVAALPSRESPRETRPTLASARTLPTWCEPSTEMSRRRATHER